MGKNAIESEGSLILETGYFIIYILYIFYNPGRKFKCTTAARDTKVIMKGKLFHQVLIFCTAVY